MSDNIDKNKPKEHDEDFIDFDEPGKDSNLSKDSQDNPTKNVTTPPNMKTTHVNFEPPKAGIVREKINKVKGVSEKVVSDTAGNSRVNKIFGFLHKKKTEEASTQKDTVNNNTPNSNSDNSNTNNNNTNKNKPTVLEKSKYPLVDKLNNMTDRSRFIGLALVVVVCGVTSVYMYTKTSTINNIDDVTVQTTKKTANDSIKSTKLVKQQQTKEQAVADKSATKQAKEKKEQNGKPTNTGLVLPEDNPKTGTNVYKDKTITVDANGNSYVKEKKNILLKDVDIAGPTYDYVASLIDNPTYLTLTHMPPNMITISTAEVYLVWTPSGTGETKNKLDIRFPEEKKTTAMSQLNQLFGTNKTLYGNIIDIISKSSDKIDSEKASSALSASNDMFKCDIQRYQPSAKPSNVKSGGAQPMVSLTISAK